MISVLMLKGQDKMRNELKGSGDRMRKDIVKGGMALVVGVLLLICLGVALGALIILIVAGFVLGVAGIIMIIRGLTSDKERAVSGQVSELRFCPECGIDLMSKLKSKERRV